MDSQKNPTPHQTNIDSHASPQVGQIPTEVVLFILNYRKKKLAELAAEKHANDGGVEQTSVKVKEAN